MLLILHCKVRLPQTTGDITNLQNADITLQNNHSIDVQDDVDNNELDSDAADVTLQNNIDDVQTTLHRLLRCC